MSIQSIRVEELLEQTHWLRGLARGLVQGDEAEDVAQDTMLSALQSPPPSDRPLRPWLARTATNVVRMNYRSKSRRERREIAFVDESVQSNSEDVVHRFEMHNTVAELMVELPEPFRSTLLFRYFDDQTSSEIAAAAGIAAGTVRWRIKRGLEMLRERLDEQGGDRKTWMLALQPMFELPSKAAIGSSSATASVAKGVIVMKVGKAAAVAVAVMGLSYGGYAVVRSEPQAQVAPTAAAPQKGEERPAKMVADLPKPKAVTKAQKRQQLLAAISEARNHRLAGAANKPVNATVRSDPAAAPTLPVGKLDKDYIRDQVREMLPQVRGCFERALERRPDLEGTAVVEFAIVGEEEVGGLVERSEYDHEASTIQDDQFSECIQETMYGLEFEPPEGGGRVSVRYPFEFRLAPPEE